MPFTNTSFNVGASPQLLVQPTTGTVSDPVPVIIFNNSTTDVVYVGGPNVSAANGLPILVKTGISFRLLFSDPVYGITAGPTVDTRVMIGRQ